MRWQFQALSWQGQDRARPALGDMDQPRFMAGREYLDTLVKTRFIYRKQRRTGNRKKATDSVCLQRPDQQHPACYLFHRQLRFVTMLERIDQVFSIGT